MFTACMAGGESHPLQCHFMSAVILRVDLYNFYTFYTPRDDPRRVPSAPPKRK